MGNTALNSFFSTFFDMYANRDQLLHSKEGLVPIVMWKTNLSGWAKEVVMRVEHFWNRDSKQR